jgi:type I restriction enzyme S subunit
MAMGKCCVGRGVAAVRHATGSRSFTYYTMRHLEDDFARFEAEGTVFGSINKAAFEGLAVVVPPADVVLRYEDLAHPLDAAVENLTLETMSLAVARDALLPKLLSGEIRIKDAEKLVEAA